MDEESKCERRLLMSIFQKMLASFGIGSAQVDTILSKAVYNAGEC